MRKLATFGAMWLAAAVVAVAVAWQGVGIVTRQVTDARPAPLEASQVRALAAAGDVASTTTVAAGGARPSSTATTPPVTTASAADPPTTTTPATSPPAAPAETRTYHLTGGTVALRFSPDGVTMAFANPKPGFEVDVEPEQGNGLRVRFESEMHRSRVTGWWDDGPLDEVREEPREEAFAGLNGRRRTG